MKPNNNLPTWPYFAEDEITAVIDVLRSGKVNYWTGDQNKLFEKEFAAFCGAEYAIAVANGTVALELALHALDIKPGDEIIVPCRTFIATASCAVARGAIPIVADIDPSSQNITVESIAKVRTPKTKAIIVVHLAGWPCDMDPIMDYAKQHKLYVIEDCAQALGAKYKDRPIGSLSDIAAFSFCQDKIMTTGGEGGMIVTNSHQLWQKAWSYKDHGKNLEKIKSIAKSNSFHWVHDNFGTNWRLTEMQAAIGREQLKKLPTWIKQRRHFADIYNQLLKSTPGINVIIPDEQFYHAYYKYYAFIRPETLKTDWTRDRIIETLVEKGVPCYSGICPEIYREQAFIQKNLSPKERFENATSVGETSLMFLLHPTLSENHIKQFCTVINETMQEACLTHEFLSC